MRELFQSLPEIGSAGNPHTCTARITLAVTPVMRKSPYAGMIFNGLGRPLNLDGVSATLPASMGGYKMPIIDEALLRDPSAKTGSGNITADCGAEKSKVRPGLRRSGSAGFQLWSRPRFRRFRGIINSAEASPQSITKSGTRFRAGWQSPLPLRSRKRFSAKEAAQ